MTTAARRDAAAADIARIMQLPMAERRGPLFTALFVRAAGPVMRQDLAPVFDRVRPDVILREAAELAAAPMAATIGPHVDSATLGTVPSNVRVERFVPQAALLERATAVISHGGAGTVLGADSHSRPRLIVPLFADQWENGIAVRDAGLRRAGRS